MEAIAIEFGSYLLLPRPCIPTLPLMYKTVTRKGRWPELVVIAPRRSAILDSASSTAILGVGSASLDVVIPKNTTVHSMR